MIRKHVAMALVACGLLSVPAAAAEAAASPARPQTVTQAMAGQALFNNYETHVARDVPPECVTLKVADPSTGNSFYLEGCGSGPAHESPFQDFMSGRILIVDGASIKPIGCGSKLSPCVTFASLSTPS